MNDDILKGKWHGFKGNLKEKWGKMMGHDLTRIDGQRERLLGAWQQKYGWAKQQIKEELQKLEKLLKNKDHPPREKFPASEGPS